MNTKIKYLSSGIIACLMLACNAAEPGTTQQAPEQKTTADTGAENAFIRKAVEDNRLAVQLGRYASGKSTDQRLKDYGIYMIGFHLAAVDQLKLMANAKGIVLSDTLDLQHQRLIDSLAPKAGNYFDSSYMSVIIGYSKTMANDYGRVADAVIDPQIRTFAAAQRDTLIRHLDRIITLKDSIHSRMNK